MATSPTRLLIFAILAVACSSAGCDTIHGVSRTLPLDGIPSLEAVEDAIRATPGVTEVTRREIPPLDSWSLYKGTIHDPESAQFICRDTASAFAALELKETSESGKQLRVYCFWMNHVPTERELSSARGLIDRLCEVLHQQIPAIPASSAADDKLIGIERR